MLRIYTLLLLPFWGIIGLGFSAKGQSTVADSLRRHLATLSPQDTLYALDLLYLWIAEGQSNPEAALKSAQKALEVSRNIRWVRGEINALNSLALTKQRQGYYSEALPFYLEALELSEKSKNPRHISKSNNNIGILYQLTADYTKALGYFRRVLQVESRPQERAAVFNNIGIVYKNTHRTDSALQYYRTALDIHQQDKNERGIAPCSNNIGIILRDRGEWPAALVQLELALRLYRKLNDLESCAVVLGSIGDVLSRMGRWAAAEDTLNKAFTLAKSQHSLIAQQDIANYFQNLYPKQGRYDLAYQWSKSYKGFADSLQFLQNRDELAAIRARFESDKRAALLEKDVSIERSRRWLWTISSLALLLILSILAYLLQQSSRRRRVERALQIEELARLHAEEETRRLQEEKLSEELAFRQRELSAQALHLVQKNELLQLVTEKIKDIKNGTPTQGNQLYTLRKLVESNLNRDDDWEDFKKHFEAVHPNFFQRLLEHYPQLSPNDLRYCAYLRLNLSSKEIASLLNVSLRGVETQRHRLRKKLKLETEQDLTLWAMQF